MCVCVNGLRCGWVGGCVNNIMLKLFCSVGVVGSYLRCKIPVSVLSVSI